jgi:hypothetical protein
MAMFGILESLAGTLCSTLRNRRDLALENLALRQQVAILRRQVRSFGAGLNGSHS